MATVLLMGRYLWQCFRFISTYLKLINVILMEVLSVLSRTYDMWYTSSSNSIYYLLKHHYLLLWNVQHIFVMNLILMPSSFVLGPPVQLKLTRTKWEVLVSWIYLKSMTVLCFGVKYTTALKFPVLCCISASKLYFHFALWLFVSFFWGWIRE